MQTAEFYDREWTDQWQDMKTYSPVARHTRRLIEKLLGRLEYRSLIDIGCGNGELLRELDLDVDRIDLHGIDLSEAAVGLAGQHVPGRFRCLDIQRDFLRESFDVGICSEVLEHLGDDRTALRNIRNMCRFLIVTVPSGPLGSASLAMGHVRHYTRQDLIRKLSDAGFCVKYIRAWGTPFHDPLYAWIRGQAPTGTTTGRYGFLRRTVSHFLYLCFFLNVMDRGQKLFALAERAVQSDTTKDP